MRRAVFPWTLASLAVAAASSCGGDEKGTASNAAAGGSSGSPAGGSGGTVAADASSGGTGAIVAGDTGAECSAGEACDGGVCAGGVCCPVERACDDECCASGDVCSFGECATPGAECTDNAECGPDEYCDYALGAPVDGGPPAADGACVGGARPPEGRCLPRPPICPASDGGAAQPDAGGATCLERCEVVPPTSSFEAVLKYAWGGETTGATSTDVMMTPIVVQLDDDDCDGRITARDIPEIVFTHFANAQYTDTGTLRAISIVGGAVVEKWSAVGISAARQLAGGNVDGQPGNEVVGCRVDATTVEAFRGDGTSLWTSSAPVLCNQPAIADLDQDGVPEVIVEGGVLDGVTGAVEATFSPPMEGTFAVADVTGDGRLDIVSNTAVHSAAGAQIATNAGPTPHAWTGGTHFDSGPAVADLDLDGRPEIVSVYFYQHALAIWRYDATQPGSADVVRAGIDINGTLNPALCAPGSAGAQWGGGPVTVGDFDADGTPDVALAGGVGYAVFEGEKLVDATVPDQGTFLWTKQTVDCSSAGTGSSLFDFNGDGRAEVIYADEYAFRIYEGATGNVLFETCNTSGTLSEYPLVADVDADGQADIVVGSNAYGYQCPDGTRTSGIRVFGSASSAWVRTRRVWNQHAYQITNTAEDGTIPAVEPANWTQTGLNNFRLNRQPDGEFLAPNAVVDVVVRCAAEAIAVTVRNVGQALLPPGVRAEVFAGTPAGPKLGEATTTIALGPAQAELLAITLASPPVDVASGATPVVAELTVPPPTVQCREDDDGSEPALAPTCGPR